MFKQEPSPLPNIQWGVPGFLEMGGLNLVMEKPIGEERRWGYGEMAMKCKKCGANLSEDEGQKWLMPILVILIAVFVLVVWGVAWKDSNLRAIIAILLLAPIAFASAHLLRKHSDYLARHVKIAIHLSSRRDLLASMESFKAELKLREAQSKGPHDADVVACKELIVDARKHYDDGDVDAGWRSLHDAKTCSLILLEDQTEKIKNCALETLFESNKRLDSWQLEYVKHRLQKSDLPIDVKDKIDINALIAARSVLYEVKDEGFARLERAAWQLYILIMVTLSSLVFIALAFPHLSPNLSPPSSLYDDSLLIAVIMVIGALGGAAGGFWSVLSAFAVKDGIPSEQVLNSWLIAMRPLIGAVFSFVAAIFLLSGLLNLGTLTLELLLSSAFVAGFAEELVLGVIKKMAGGPSLKAL